MQLHAFIKSSLRFRYPWIVEIKFASHRRSFYFREIDLASRRHGMQGLEAGFCDPPSRNLNCSMIPSCDGKSGLARHDRDVAIAGAEKDKSLEMSTARPPKRDIQWADVSHPHLCRTVTLMIIGLTWNCMLSRVDGSWVPGLRNARNVLRCPLPIRITILSSTFTWRIHGRGYFLYHVRLCVQCQSS